LLKFLSRSWVYPISTVTERLLLASISHLFIGTSSQPQKPKFTHTIVC
jgi:hypothetical protein